MEQNVKVKDSTLYIARQQTQNVMWPSKERVLFTA